MEVEFTSSGIVFHEYPYPPASVHRDGHLPYSAIREVGDWGDIWTQRGEVLFVPGAQKEDLAAAAERNAIPLVRRVDVWELLLEPFLDTTFDADYQERTLVTLERNGIGRDESRRIRRRLRGAMISYNITSGLWDWIGLGLSDVLDAKMGIRVGSAVPWWRRISLGRDETFYWWAMEIANRSRKET
ncbi:MAG: hypothetical protein NTW19_17290 [Planctomycetota bacterium]|nr:hypothetical protein [Planctomycetota bacterium]